MRLAAFAVAASLVATRAGHAWAAGDCPDGDWFCDPAPIPAPGGPPAGPETERGPAPSPAAEAPPASELERREREEREARIALDVERIESSKPRRRHRFREWGVNLHASLGLMGDEPYAAPDAGMNGLGGSLRFHFIRHIALEASLELLWGTDYNGFDRFEDGVLVSGLFFVNPRSAVQVYGIAGFGVGGAWLNERYETSPSDPGHDRTYSYFGGQLGFGVEARITRHYALGGDLLGFVRARNDRHAAAEPEFVDPVTHRTSNTSGGGLVRLGATFYW